MNIESRGEGPLEPPAQTPPSQKRARWAGPGIPTKATPDTEVRKKKMAFLISVLDAFFHPFLNPKIVCGPGIPSGSLMVLSIQPLARPRRPRRFRGLYESNTPQWQVPLPNPVSCRKGGQQFGSFS